jgi:hypothetical protein
MHELLEVLDDIGIQANRNAHFARCRFDHGTTYPDVPRSPSLG